MNLGSFFVQKLTRPQKILVILPIVLISFSFLVGPPSGHAEREIMLSLHSLEDHVFANRAGLIGLNAQEIYHLFDAPESVRKDLDISLWRYRSKICVLDIFMKKTENAFENQALYAEIRPRLSHMPQVAWKDCFISLINQKSKIKLAWLEH